MSANKTSAITMAKALDDVAARQGTKKNFVMISSDKLPVFGKNLESKLEAEEIIKDECPNLNLYCVRPGLIWSTRDRRWTYLMKFPVDLLHHVGDKVVGKIPIVNYLEFLFPAHTTEINTVGHYAIEAVMGNLDHTESSIISNETLNAYEDGLKFEARE